ncbi:hypothetical protein PPERSA_01920 [Pseudocohnilembus persalinus]|uniref:Uncharacterized protein n=1 Tax=Pseudocohnilembus persalinus TaxID=266149 RepID=A0A0V0R3F0_PSEPJ|nr:hypothetical protein PPERSA_01920 [Pseudocohnilembus persalinus]|eukprot:KRX09033.1 hypothetical protein PPERSA_01920 [Pseudocohnilembus persalinus]
MYALKKNKQKVIINFQPNLEITDVIEDINKQLSMNNQNKIDLQIDDKNQKIVFDCKPNYQVWFQNQEESQKYIENLIKIITQLYQINQNDEKKNKFDRGGEQK